MASPSTGISPSKLSHRRQSALIDQYANSLEPLPEAQRLPPPSFYDVEAAAAASSTTPLLQQSSDGAIASAEAESSSAAAAVDDDNFDELILHLDKEARALADTYREFEEMDRMANPSPLVASCTHHHTVRQTVDLVWAIRLGVRFLHTCASAGVGSIVRHRT